MAYKAQNSVKQDREMDYTRDDYRNAMAPRPMDEDKKSGEFDKVPDLAPVISEDKKNILPQPLVSITVNQDVPLRDIFFELAKQAEVDLELDPTITGSIIFTAYNRPFDQVVDRIAEMAGLRYTFKNNILRVERDTPYLHTYRLDYLSMTRDYTSTIKSNTSAASGSGSGGGGSQNGSESTITTKSNADFWKELENNITQIIQNTNTQVSLTDQGAPVTTPNAIQAVSTADLATVGTPAGGTAPAPAAAGSSAAPIAGLLNPTGTQTAADSKADPSAGGSSVQLTNPYFAVNKAAGLLNIFATERQHRKVAHYLAELRRATNTQVLIEAKVFEVELNDESTTGIDWNAVVGNVSFGTNLPRQGFQADPAVPGAGGIFKFNHSKHFKAVVDALQRFGTVRTLSSPRITAMNNQTAVLNVSESRVFFEFEIQRTDGTITTPSRVDITTEVKNVPEGIIITVQPSVDPDTKEITMNLRPSITRVVRTVSDPAAFIASGGDIENLVPELSIREIDSVVKMRSGSTIVMGGLMQDRADSRQQGVPVLSETPLLGPLFRNQRDGIRKTEMVIMLRATVADQPGADETDKTLYKKMSNDRRPWTL